MQAFIGRDTAGRAANVQWLVKGGPSEPLPGRQNRVRGRVMPIRLDQLVAKRFGLSRRVAREAIRNGRIDLAGQRSDEPGLAVESDAAVAFFPNRPKARKVA